MVADFPNPAMPAKKTTQKIAKPAAKKTAKKASAPESPVSQPKSPKAKKAAKPASAPSKFPAPSTDEVAHAAYLNYRRRVEHGIPGSHDEDWLKAEAELSQGKRSK
jgi:hypothetical protein